MPLELQRVVALGVGGASALTVQPRGTLSDAESHPRLGLSKVRYLLLSQVGLCYRLHMTSHLSDHLVPNENTPLI